MKKILLSFLGLGIIVGGVGVLYAQTTTSTTTAVSKTQAAATVIAQLLNEKDQEYVQKFYTAFDALVAKYTTAKDTARVTILNEMKNVFLSKVKVLPAGYNVSCYDTSKPAGVCTKEYAPICGEDVHTYGNKCALEAAGVKALHEGVCKAEDKPTICTMEYAPVCGTDKKTYGNLCGLKASDAGFLFTGTCEDNLQKLSCAYTEQTPVAVCTMEYAPVCGTDGKTYDNPCLAKAAGVEYTQGACIIGKCTKDYKPVCGKDGKTYSNDCLANAAGTTMDYEGVCVETKA